MSPMLSEERDAAIFTAAWALVLLALILFVSWH